MSLSRFESHTGGRFARSSSLAPGDLARQSFLYTKMQEPLLRIETCHPLEMVYGCESTIDFEENPCVLCPPCSQPVRETDLVCPPNSPQEEESPPPPEVSVPEYVASEPEAEAPASPLRIEIPEYDPSADIGPVFVPLVEVPVDAPPAPPAPLVKARSRTMFDVIQAVRRQPLVDAVSRARKCPPRSVAVPPPIAEESASNPIV